MFGKHKFSAVAVGTVIVAGLVGVGAGAAVAVGPVLLSPAGVTTEKGVSTTPMKAPHYASNTQGLTYGSAAQAPSDATEPDLILTTATNGVSGYVKKSDLDNANGTTAAQSFHSPADALAWQKAHEGKPAVSIPVYASDGTTVVGQFTVSAPEPQ